MTLALIAGIAHSQESAYTLGKFNGGTPYVRLKIPESTNQWTCFDESTYEKILDLSLDAPLKDSTIENLELQIQQCGLNETDIKAALELSQNNLKTLDKAHKQYAIEKTVEIEQEKIKKWYWGAGGGLIGGLLGALLTAILIAK
jgi:hypothetical protein